MTDSTEPELFDKESEQESSLTLNHDGILPSDRILSACAGALITTLFVTPLDVVKVRLQSAGLQTPTAPTGTWNTLSIMLRREGFTSLWRGLSAGIVMAAPSTVIYFVGYDWIRDHTRHATSWAGPILHDSSPLWAGGVARMAAAVLISPIELFRTRLQSLSGPNPLRVVHQSIAKDMKHDGPRLLWRGLLPTLLRDVPFSAVYWMGYEHIKQRLQKDDPTHNTGITFVAGALSGMLAAIATTPFDVLKTQRQVCPSGDASLYYLAQQIVAHDGYQGFLRGVVPRILKVAPSCAIMISSYELGKRFFADQRRAQS